MEDSPSVTQKQFNHVAVGVGLYLSCLLFTAFYVGETWSPWSAINCFTRGWIGILSGGASWLANPLFLIALIKANKTKTSMWLGFTALLFALSFLFQAKILVDAGGGEREITAYGVGYFLWVLGIAAFTLGQYLKSEHPEIIYAQQIKIMGGFFSTMIIGYSAYYFIHEAGIYKTQRDKELHFEELCKEAKNIFYVTPSPVSAINGIYIEHAGSDTFDKIRNGKYAASGGAIMGLNNAYTFVEQKTAKDQERYSEGKPYMRESLSNRNNPYPIDELEAEFSVIGRSTTDHLPKRFDLHGAEITVIDRKTNTIVGKTSYISTTHDRKICAENNANIGTIYEGYSTGNFVRTALGLK